MIKKQDFKIAIIGLGYVGLPLAVEFGKKFKTVGFDINEIRIKELLDYNDSTMEVSRNQLLDSKSLILSSNSDDIKNCNIFCSRSHFFICCYFSSSINISNSSSFV